MNMTSCCWIFYKKYCWRFFWSLYQTLFQAIGFLETFLTLAESENQDWDNLIIKMFALSFNNPVSIITPLSTLWPQNCKQVHSPPQQILLEYSSSWFHCTPQASIPSWLNSQFMIHLKTKIKATLLLSCLLIWITIMWSLFMLINFD